MSTNYQIPAASVASILPKLEDNRGDFQVKVGALWTLGFLPPDVLVSHAGAVVAKLLDTNAAVRKEALQTLGKLPPEVLAKHGAAVVAKLQDADGPVREAALKTLGKLTDDVLARLGPDVLKQVRS